MFGPCFDMQYLVTLLFLQSSILAEEKRAGFCSLSSCCLVAVYGAVGWCVVCDCDIL